MIFRSFGSCPKIFESVFPFDQRNAELGLDAGVGIAGGEATQNEAPSRRTGAAEHQKHTEANATGSIPSGRETRSGDPRAAGGHLPHDACEARRTFDAGEQSGHGTFRDQIEGGTAATGRAARLRMGGQDDGFNHGHSTLRGRQAESGGIHVQRELTGDSSAERLLDQSKKHFRRTGSSGRGLPDSAHLVPHHQSHESEGCQREFRPGSSGEQRAARKNQTPISHHNFGAGEKEAGHSEGFGDGPWDQEVPGKMPSVCGSLRDAETGQERSSLGETSRSRGPLRRRLRSSGERRHA